MMDQTRYHYRVPAVLDASESLTADVPAGTSWVGAPCTEGDCYVVLTLTELPEPAVLVDLEQLPECCDATASGIGSWQIGGQ